MGCRAWGAALRARAAAGAAHHCGGRFALDLRYFRHLREGVDMTGRGASRTSARGSQELAGLLGPARRPTEEPRSVTRTWRAASSWYTKRRSSIWCAGS